LATWGMKVELPCPTAPCVMVCASGAALWIVIAAMMGESETGAIEPRKRDTAAWAKVAAWCDRKVSRCRAGVAEKMSSLSRRHTVGRFLGDVPLSSPPLLVATGTFCLQPSWANTYHNTNPFSPTILPQPSTQFLLLASSITGCVRLFQYHLSCRL